MFDTLPEALRGQGLELALAIQSGWKHISLRGRRIKAVGKLRDNGRFFLGVTGISFNRLFRRVHKYRAYFSLSPMPLKIFTR